MRMMVCLVAFVTLIGNFSFASEQMDKIRASYKGKTPKYVFFFIGDGLSVAQINATEAYLASLKDNTIGVDKLNFCEFTSQGMSTTYSLRHYITESAAAGTALATGIKTKNDVLCMDEKGQTKYRSISKMAKEKGMKVGIVSSVSIDHATPACFYSCQPTRKNYYEIGIDLVESNFDYFAGGGFLDPDGKKSKSASKGNVIEYAKSKGYQFINSKSDFMNLKPGSNVLAVNKELDSEKALPYSIDADSSSISLAEFTRKGIELLDNKNGFFMMVEGGKIDWACHANDGVSSIHDVLAFEQAIEEAVDFAQKHPKETIIIVTGDHECGGMSVGFAGTKYETAFNVLKNQKKSYLELNNKIDEYRKATPPENVNLNDLLPVIQELFGLGNKELNLALSDYEMEQLSKAFSESMKDKKIREDNTQNYLLYGGYEPLSITVTHLLNQKAGIGWTTYSHTGTPVPVYAKGVGEDLFRGYYDNTDIPLNLMKICSLK